MKGDHGFFSRAFTPGTLPCAIMCTVAGLLFALLLQWGGIWRTLIVAIVIAVCLFLGAVRDKKEFFERIMRRLKA